MMPSKFTKKMLIERQPLAATELDFGGHNPELDFGERKCLFHAKRFLAILFAIGNMATWGAMASGPLGSTPGSWCSIDLLSGGKYITISLSHPFVCCIKQGNVLECQINLSSFWIRNYFTSMNSKIWQ